MRRNALILKAAILAAALLAAAAAQSTTIEQLHSQAQPGDTAAQNTLGAMYAEGRDVPRNYVKALYWYLRAAEQGHAEAQFNAGSMYYYGRGVPAHYPPALKWYLRAAERGHAGAQFKLGLMYAKGQVLPRNYKEAANAWRHLRKAANSPGRLAALLAVGAAWAGVTALPWLTYLVARRRSGAPACCPPAPGGPEKG